MKKIIRKLSYGMCGILAAVALGGCLDEEVYGKYEVDSYYSDLENLEMAVLNCYAPLQSTTLYAQNMFHCFDGDTDIQHATGLAVPSKNSGRNMGHYYITPNETAIENTWKTLYNGIKDTNTVLEYGTGLSCATDEERVQKERLLAEAKFMRALMYFDLVRFWGDVPLIVKPAQMGDDLLLGRTDREEVYARIVQDLEEAQEALPWHDESGAAAGRTHKGAAMGFLARVNLYRGGYSLGRDGVMRRPENYLDYYRETEKWTSLLIESGKHNLNTRYETIFRNYCTGVLEPRESLFEVDLEYVPGKLSGGMVGAYNGNKVAKGVYNVSSPKIGTHYLFYEMFDEGDLRREVAVAAFSTNKEGKETPINSTGSENFSIGKWRRQYQDERQFERDNMTNINFVLLRYADVLLMRAEALNEVNDGPTDEAVELVNQVRRRGYGLPANTAVTEMDAESGYVDKQLADFAGHDAFLSFIQDERARELAFESAIRRTDLIRWNLLAKKITDTYNYVEEHRDGRATEGTPVFYNNSFRFVAYEHFTPGKHELYPIPAREIRENSALKGAQNPGYAE